eukprot:s5145_g1.t1
MEKSAPCCFNQLSCTVFRTTVVGNSTIRASGQVQLAIAMHEVSSIVPIAAIARGWRTLILDCSFQILGALRALAWVGCVRKTGAENTSQHLDEPVAAEYHPAICNARPRCGENRWTPTASCASVGTDVFIRNLQSSGVIKGGKHWESEFSLQDVATESGIVAMTVSNPTQPILDELISAHIASGTVQEDGIESSLSIPGSSDATE